MCLESYIKAVIGWIGLLYFFVTDDENWGEAIGLTLFYSSGQLRLTLRPSFLVGGYKESLQDLWCALLGIGGCVYYFYYQLYLNAGLNIYTSTICLTLFWESQIVDCTLDKGVWWTTHELPSKILKVLVKVHEILGFLETTKNQIQNRIQTFLCGLCKLYKHSISTFWTSSFALNIAQLVKHSLCMSDLKAKNDSFITGAPSRKALELQALAEGNYSSKSENHSALPGCDAMRLTLSRPTIKSCKASAVRQQIWCFPCVF